MRILARTTGTLQIIIFVLFVLTMTANRFAALLLLLSPLICISISSTFPTLEDTLEMALLSGVVYDFWGMDGCNVTMVLPHDWACRYYHHDKSQGAQVLVVTSSDAIGIIFSGTDDLRTSVADGDIVLKPFGPLDEYGNSIKIPGPARVHAGFDNAVFEHGLYDAVVEIVNDLRRDTSYRILTTGHSLGASDSLLLSVGMALDYPDVHISNINFGCPRTGNQEWRKVVHHSLPNLSVFRFVLGWDLVPRLPEYPFYHVGHTVQLDTADAKAYYLHSGNATLDYAGVPMGWGSMPFFWVPGALYSHHIKNYEDYLFENSVKNESVFFVSNFERSAPSNDDHTPSISDDEYVNPPDDALTFEAELSMMERLFALL